MDGRDMAFILIPPVLVREKVRQAWQKMAEPRKPYFMDFPE